MVQYASYPGLLTSLPIVEEVLDDHAWELGHDLIAYRNHVYRVVNLCLAIGGESRVELDKIAVRKSAVAGRIISACRLDRRDPRITKVRPSARIIAAVATMWPSAGFHRRLVELTIDRFWRHPLSPLPMVKW